MTNLRSYCVEIVVEFVDTSTDVADTAVFHARATSATKNLQDVQDGKVYEGTSPTIVYLGALDNDYTRSE